jgi:hypothetical protein
LDAKYGLLVERFFGAAVKKCKDYALESNSQTAREKGHLESKICLTFAFSVGKMRNLIV